MRIRKVYNNYTRAITAMAKASDRASKNLADLLLTTASENIQRDKIIDEGTLLKSGYNRKVRDGLYRVGFSAPHAEPTEYGAAPHMPPVDPLIKWVKRNIRVTARDKKTGHFETVVKPETKVGTKIREDEARKIAWAIAINIKHFGQEPRPFFRPAIHEARKERNAIFSREFFRALGGKSI